MGKIYYYRLKILSSFTLVILLSTILLSIVACSGSYTKVNYLNDFEKFVVEIEANHFNYTSHEWELADNKYEHLTISLYQQVQASLTSEDQKTIGKLKARYESLKLKNTIKNGIKSIKDGLQQAAGALENVIDSI